MIDDEVKEIIDCCGGSTDPRIVEAVKQKLLSYGVAVMIDSSYRDEIDDILDKEPKNCIHADAYYCGDTNPPIFKCPDCDLTFVKH